MALTVIPPSGVDTTGSFTFANVNVTANTTTANFTATGNVTLGAVANVHISGGSNTYVLKTDGAGNLSWGAAISTQDFLSPFLLMGA